MKKIILILFNKIILILIKFKLQIKVTGKCDRSKNIYNNVDEIVDKHFNELNEPNHPCKESLLNVLTHLDSSSESVIIIETGSSAWGTNSSNLFDKFITYRNESKTLFNQLLTCDIRINPLLSLIYNVSPSTTLYCNDSVLFLKQISNEYINSNHNFLIYLDSFDLDYNNPSPSGLHGLKELLAIVPLLKKGTILLIDDSPLNINYCPDHAKNSSKIYFDKYGIYPGKGMFIDPIIQNFKNVKKIFHKYQIIYIVE